MSEGSVEAFSLIRCCLGHSADYLRLGNFTYCIQFILLQLVICVAPLRAETNQQSSRYGDLPKVEKLLCRNKPCLFVRVQEEDVYLLTDLGFRK